MKRILFASAAAVLLSTQAFAQTQFPASTLWGNVTASTGLPTTVAIPNCPSGALNFTSGTGLGCGVISGGGSITLPHTHLLVGNGSNVAADFGSFATISDVGNMTLNPTVNNGGLLINQSGTGYALATSQTITGSLTGSQYFSNIINIPSDNADASGNINQTMYGMLMQYNMGGAAMRGSRGGIGVIMQLLSQPGTQSPDWAYVAMVPQVRAAASSGGTNTTTNPIGGVWGINPDAILANGATNYVQVTGMEVNVGIETGASAKGRQAILIAENGAATVQGTLTDAAIAMSSQFGAVGWRNGILFDAGWAQAPIKSNGTAIATAGAQTMANFIDASSATITGAFLKSAGFVVNGLGVASVNGMHTIASVSPTCSATGIGSGGTCTFNTIGSTTFAGQIILTIGSGAAATGLVTITPTVTGNTTCVANPTNNSGIWNLSATTWMSGVGPTPVIGWSNSGTALTAGLLYLIAYICVGF